MLLAKGRRLTDRDLMLAAAMNHPTRAGASRGRRSRCSAPATSWCRPAATPGPGEIVYSNGFALMALARGEGAEVIDLGIVPRPDRRHRRRDPARPAKPAPTSW